MIHGPERQRKVSGNYLPVKQLKTNNLKIK